MSLTTTPGYVRCAMPFGVNDHCDFALIGSCLLVLVLYTLLALVISGLMPFDKQRRHCST